MLDYLLYTRFPENRETVNLFFNAMFYWNENYLPNYIENVRLMQPIYISDELECHFASEFSTNDEEYFGESGVVIYAESPIVDEDSAVIMTERQFIDAFHSCILQHEQDFSRSQFRRICSDFDVASKELLKLN